MAETLLTFFIILAIGFLLRATNRLPASISPAIDTLVMDVTMPALALYALNGQRLHSGMALAVAVSWIAVAVSIAATLLITKAMRAPRSMQGAASLTGGLCNTGFVGLPLVLQLLHNAPDSAATAMMIDIFNTTLLLYTFAVAWAMRFGHQGRFDGRLLLRVVATPTFVAVALGILLAALHQSLPQPALTMCETLGHATVPLVLLSLGLRPDFRAMRGRRAAPVIASAAIKLVLCPLVAAACVALFRLRGVIGETTVLQCAMPSSMMSAVIAARYGCDGELASATVALTTVACVLTIPLALAIAVNLK